MKKIISVILCFSVIAISSMVLNLDVSADGEAYSGVCGDGLVWEFKTENSTLTVSGNGDLYDYEKGMLYSDDNEPVDNAQYIAEQIKTVVLNEGVTSIGSMGRNNAFSNCPNITAVYIPSTVKYIGNSQFEDFLHLEKISVSKDNEYFYDINGILVQTDKSSDGESIYRIPNTYKGKLLIPDGIKYINRSAGSNCKEITEIVFPDSVSYIYYNAFSGCSALTNVELPNYITAVLSEVFENCYNLKTITIPQSLTEIREDSFLGCNNLSDIYYDGTKADWEKLKIEAGNDVINEAAIHYGNEKEPMISAKIAGGICGPNIVWELDSDGTLHIEGKGQMYCWNASNDVPWNNYRSEIKSVVISEEILSVGNYAFLNCANLTSVKMPDSVLDIGSYAFYGCGSITDINFLSRSITQLDSDAEFGYCNGLTNVVIPEHITYLNPSAFRECKNIQKIHIPSSVVNSLTDFNAFGGEKLTSIFVDKENIQNYTVDDVLYAYAAHGGWLGNRAKTLTRCPPQKSGDFIIPDDTRAIGYGSFRNCKNIKSVTIPSGVKLIATDAFEGCTGLTDIYFKGTKDAWNTVTVRDKHLENVSVHILGDKEETTGSAASGTCGASVTWSFNDGTLSLDGSGKMYDYEAESKPWQHLEEYINNVVIGNEITYIGEYAFYSCESLKTIALPASVADIGKYAFYLCDNLTSIKWLCDIKHIGQSAFGKTGYSDNPDNWHGNLLCLNNWIIDCQSDSTEFYIPEDIIGITDNAFHLLSNNVLRFSVDANNQFFCSADGVLFSKDMSVLIRYPTAKENSYYSIPSTVIELCDGAFWACNNLKSIAIPEGITHIKGSTFSGTYNLTDVYIPESIKLIEGNAFMKAGRIYVKDNVYCSNSPLNIHYAGSKEELDRIMVGSDVETVAASQEYWDQLDSTVINVFSEICVELNSQPLYFDQPPIIEEGRTLVPLRVIFEMLGASVDWNDATRTVVSTKGNTKIEMTIGKSEFFKNGEAKFLDVPAKIINGRALVPVRAVAESFNCNVIWYGNTKTVNISN